MTLIKNSLLAITIASAFFAVSCEKKTEAERTVDKVENKIKDATDSRPAEGIRDAAEDITK